MSQSSKTKPNLFDQFVENCGLGVRATQIVFGLGAVVLPSLVLGGVVEFFKGESVNLLAHGSCIAGTLGLIAGTANYSMSKKAAAAKSQPTPN